MEKLVSLPRLTMLRGIFYSFSSSFLFPLLFLTNFIRSDSKATDKYVDEEIVNIKTEMKKAKIN